MVGAERVRSALLLLQLVSVAGVCFSHFPLAMLRSIDGAMPATFYSQPAVWGLGFLFLSSGFLLHISFDGADGTPAGARAVDIVFRRFWRLLLPVVLALVADLTLTSFRDFGRNPNTATALPYLLTLTQTWYFRPLGAASLPLPVGGSNMAWLGSNLFFLSVAYAFTHALWRRCGRATCMFLLAACSLGYLAYMTALGIHTDEIAAWSADHYGANMPFSVSFPVWLLLHGPYANILIFFSGVALAQLYRISQPDSGWMVVVLVLALALVFWGTSERPQHLGLNLLIISAIILWAQSSPGPGQAGDGAPARWLQTMSPYAYEICTLHLVIYLPFTLNVVPERDTQTVILLLGRLVVVNALMLLLSIGATVLLTEPARRRVLSLFRLEAKNDRFV